MSDRVHVPDDLKGNAGLYNSPDPLLRRYVGLPSPHMGLTRHHPRLVASCSPTPIADDRIRLEDELGNPVTDIYRTLRDVEVVVFYAGSAQGAPDTQSVAIVYVSTDTSLPLYSAATANQPWLKMIYKDGSDFAAVGEEMTEETSRDEDFVQAAEIETGAEEVPYGEKEDIAIYERPLSRAAMAMSMRAYRTPSIAVYSHVPSHAWIDRNVRPSLFEEQRVNESLAKWRAGETVTPGVGDIVTALKFPLIFLVLAIIYHFVVWWAGEEYNLIPYWLDQMSWVARQAVGVVRAD
ncbi:hypothetical protein A1Q2_00807 [Trichosporon asahii var. asahii CBS 8904]|uniref:Uncharacterized protein n=1 Tax=Trichosporon asahii var. asahii (strain CBS 8904) TaxID=1220162 RepID=K1VWD5_TRIAC|nr:hypothetical protein A1Q2_00807 [Trichosporon asahii var. asahii CBS 8904]